MTKEEYLAHTNIQSIQEADGYLSKLRILFITVFFFPLIEKILPALTSDLGDSLGGYIQIFFLLLHVIVLVYFIVFCVKVIKAEKISRANAVFSVIFAPFSWFWFYPDITDPLKIIIGEKEPPESFQVTISNKDKSINKKAANKSFLYSILLATGISAVFLLFIIIIIMLDLGNS